MKCLLINPEYDTLEALSWILSEEFKIKCHLTARPLVAQRLLEREVYDLVVATADTAFKLAVPVGTIVLVISTQNITTEIERRGWHLLPAPFELDAFLEKIAELRKKI